MEKRRNYCTWVISYLQGARGTVDAIVAAVKGAIGKIGAAVAIFKLVCACS